MSSTREVNMSDKLAVVIAMYNESGSIRNVLTSLKSVRPGDTIIVVDDGSSDGCYAHASEVKGIHLLRHAYNLGQGAALQTGIEYAKRIGMDYVVTYDADGQHDAHDIQPFLDTIRSGEYDVILGSRFMGSTVNMSRMKHYVLKFSIWFGYLFSGLRLTDSHNGFRMLNLKSFPQFEITQNEMSHASEILDIIRRNKLRYIEMPCTIIYTDYSKAKGQSILNSVNIIIEYLIGKVR